MPLNKHQTIFTQTFNLWEKKKVNKIKQSMVIFFFLFYGILFICRRKTKIDILTIL